MKNKLTRPADQTDENTGKGSCRQGRLARCEKVIAQMAKTKEIILDEFRQSLALPERMLRLALNEAEAVAWQTAIPHLVFPTLAAEKLQAVAKWNITQQALRRTRPGLAFAV